MSIKSFTLRHDEDKTFMAIYILLSLILCTFLSLFWFIIIIGAHCSLDILKGHYQQFNKKNLVIYSLKQNRLDFLFVVIGITLVFLINFGIGVAGLRLLRGARFMKGVKTIKTAKLFKKVKAVKVAKSFKKIKAIKAAKSLKKAKVIKGIKFSKEKFGKTILEKATSEIGQRTLKKLVKYSKGRIGWWKSLSVGDKISIVVLLICLYFIIVDPLLQGVPAQSISHIIWEEIRPTFEFRIPW